MAFSHQFKSAHKDIQRYYEELADYRQHEVAHETAVRSAFQNLLAATAKKAAWHLVPEQPTRVRGKQVRPDGTLRDDFNLHRGYWEAKDTAQNLNENLCRSASLSNCNARADMIYTSILHEAASQATGVGRSN
jgi:hypothetical protein